MNPVALFVAAIVVVFCVFILMDVWHATKQERERYTSEGDSDFPDGWEWLQETGDGCVAVSKDRRR